MYLSPVQALTSSRLAGPLTKIHDSSSPVMSRYRDRKLGRQAHFVGYDAYVDATTRGQLKNAFDGNSSVVGNWDVMEGVLDYIFLKLGVDGANGGIDRPILMTEPIANLGYPRRSMLVFLAASLNDPS